MNDSEFLRLFQKATIKAHSKASADMELAERLFEIYSCFVAVGFDEDQAMFLISIIMEETYKNQKGGNQ